MQQDPAAEFLPVDGLRIVRFPIVYRQTCAEIKEKALFKEVLPDAAGIHLAGISFGIDRETKVGPDTSMPDLVTRRKDEFGIQVDTALFREAAPQVVGIVVKHPKTDLMNPSAAAISERIRGGQGNAEKSKEHGRQ